ncbi:MAG: MAPEG family protein [Gammaproteobacteria bacterium]|nr:MAPEG family protein [Gammaproteobacteria bacterium]
MSDAYLYLGLSGLLTVLLWVPYIAARALQWGIPTFLHNYPKGYPAVEPTPPLWAQRAKRAHLNMVETLPAFAVVLIAAIQLGADAAFVGGAAQLFFFARIAHAVVYTLGVPALRTPTYLVSWGAILAIGASLLG